MKIEVVTPPPAPPEPEFVLTLSALELRTIERALYKDHPFDTEHYSVNSELYIATVCARENAGVVEPNYNS